MNAHRRLDLGRDLHAWEDALLEVCDLYLVGGTVRDLLLGMNVDSIDADYLAAGIAIDDLVSRLGRFGSLSLVGKSFGVIKFTAPSARTVDISLPRAEFSTGPAHRDFTIRFDPSLPVEKDLERRDYTINSMAFHLRHRSLIDPLGGETDLGRRILRVNRDDSFVEDPLRILRGVQFMARFELSVERQTSALMRRDGRLLETVSPERVRDELNKMLLFAVKPSRGFVFMHDEEMLGLVLPELERTFGEEQNEYHPDDLFTHSIKSCDMARAELHLRWSALLHDLGKRDMKQVISGRIVFYRHEERSARIADALFERLKFPHEFRKKVISLIEHHMFNMTEEWSDGAVRRFIARIGKDNIEDLLALREADGLSRGDAKTLEENRTIRARVERILASDAAFKIKDLAITGGDVMELLGMGEGPEVGAILRELFDIVLERPEYNSREKLISIVRGMGKKK
jgi:tRNA nucleotidyltransferase (CCA-adding enzyme)